MVCRAVKLKDLKMNTKFELTEETIVHQGVTLHRIRALKNFGHVKAGSLGGFVEEEENLSSEGECWISGNAKVYGDAVVYGNAQVYGNAWVSGDSEVYGYSMVYGNAVVYDNALIYGGCVVSGNAQVYGAARVYGDAVVYGYSMVYGNAMVYGNSKVPGNARISGTQDIIGFSNVGSEDGFLTCYKTEGGIEVTRGCFRGSDVQFLEAVKQKHGDSLTGKEYTLLIEVARLRLGTVQ
jgi:carbonic anhydrase/acetyltransferase-like protein (isoleucine patch superfamily)